VSAELGVFGGDHNKVHLVSAAGVESWPEMTKAEVARKLMERLAQMLVPQQQGRRMIEVDIMQPAAWRRPAASRL
jgi:hypothetical protein